MNFTLVQYRFTAFMQRISNSDKFKMTVLPLIKCWTFRCMDHPVLQWYSANWRI